MIPRILHRICLGDHPWPAVYDEYWRQWAVLHRGWDLHTWTERSIPPLRNQPEYNHCEDTVSAGVPTATAWATAVQRANIAAYELVWRFGGVYVNCDMLPLRPLDDLLKFPAFAGIGDDRYVCNAVLGGEPRSPFFDAVISELPFRMAANPHAGMEVQTGPQLLTTVWWQHPELLAVLPREVFAYAHDHHSHSGEDAAAHLEAAYRAGAYAIHHCGHRTCGGDSAYRSAGAPMPVNDPGRLAGVETMRAG